MLLSSSRSKASKVVALLTDGCQNHIWDPLATPRAKSCGCTSETACATNTNCTGDITTWYKWLIKSIPGVKIISIGVGTTANICPEQLKLVAGGDVTMVFNPQSWADLITIVQTISATACTTDNVLCPGCCGICSCGVCYPASNCFSPDACNTGVVLAGSQCCGTEPITCTPGPCQYVSACDPKNGCVFADVVCKPPAPCYEYYCDAASVKCTTRPINQNSTQCNNITISECYTDTDCTDPTLCTTDSCVAGKCQNIQITCAANTKCSNTVCRPNSGCYTTNLTCNDNNLCTEDSCDPSIGCVFKNITCQTSPDPCILTKCDPEKYGCLNYTDTCPTLTAANCSAPFCNETCYMKYTCATAAPSGEENAPPTTIILASTLTTAAIAGIIIGAVCLAVGLGGGAVVAVAGGAGAGGVTAVFSNPVYSGTDQSGNNPLNAAG
jgi:hypothetical protein